MRAQEFIIEETLPSVKVAKQNILKILAAAQEQYDTWDETDRDTYAGGGICHLIADAVCGVLSDLNIDCVTVSCNYDQHVYVAAKFNEGVFTIDIPYHVYEQGAGFTWTKLPDIKFEPNDVVFYRQSPDPEDFKDYTDDINEVRIDNQEGWGSTPYNQDVDYFGLRVQMQPRTFLKLASPLAEPTSQKDIEQHIQSGGAIGAPFLMIDIPSEWFDGDLSEPAQVTGHEGRNRMRAILAVEGNQPVEVHLFPRGLRHRHLTPKIIQALNRGMYAERTKVEFSGPLFAVT